MFEGFQNVIWMIGKRFHSEMMHGAHEINLHQSWNRDYLESMHPSKLRRSNEIKGLKKKSANRGLRKTSTLPEIRWYLIVPVNLTFDNSR